MSMSGSHSLSVENIANRCLEEGFEIIYIHSRSFQNYDKLIKFKENIFKEAPHIFGMVSELQEETNQNLVNFANDISLVNLLQMGVPIGKFTSNISCSVKLTFLKKLPTFGFKI